MGSHDCIKDENGICFECDKQMTMANAMSEGAYVLALNMASYFRGEQQVWRVLRNFYDGDHGSSDLRRFLAVTDQGMTVSELSAIASRQFRAKEQAYREHVKA